MKNYLVQTFGFALLVLALLAGLSALPDHLSVSGYPLRKMDIFSDIRTPQVPLASPDSLLLDTTGLAVDTTLALNADTNRLHIDSLGLVPVVDSALFGQIFEDYTFRKQGLAPFFAAIDSIRTQGRTVRVAFFGDSFVEGDILLGDLRDTLQTVWGGNGVGFVPITSEVARFKRTLVHQYDNWNTYSIVKNHESHQPFGINGFVYRPRQEAFVRYEGADYFHHTGHWSQFRLFYQSAQNATPVTWQKGEAQAQIDTLEAQSDRLNVWKRNDPAFRTVSLRFEHPDSSLALYGATLEDGPGFYLDNFSVRGNTGGRLRLIQPGLARQFDNFQHYDLIVVQLGLNAVTTRMDNIRWYRAELEQTFAHLQNCFPGKTILLISVADRAGKLDGELVTLPSVAAITAMQRDLARQHGFLFYDMYHGMGGPGTMIRFANQKPALANKDYTHLTHEGGKLMGHLFAKLFLDAQYQYQRGKDSTSSR